ncbi:MAG: TIGR04552 family protein [Myxococcales bacterium]|nr:TIGR04552 family protein [Myxococcales bacterium]
MGRVKRLDEFSLHDTEAVRLILQGGSVIDWHRLNLESEEQARGLLVNHDLDPDDPVDRGYVEYIKREAIAYLRRNFSFAIPRPVEQMSMEQLMLLASGKGHRQLCACTILKAVQIINHLTGRELLFRLPVSDRELFHLVEEKVYRVVGTMLSQGFPITEFMGGRKSLDSMYTKLLSKPESTAAAIYDKLRFRIVTREPADVLPVLLYLTEQLFPFNYVVPGESVNSIVDLTHYIESNPQLARHSKDLQQPLDPSASQNRFSADTYRVINFIADMPVRVPPQIMELAPPGSEELGRTVYMLCEFQLLDSHTEATNEAGEASHDAYKARQRGAVARRLRLGARAATRPVRAQPGPTESRPDNEPVPASVAKPPRRGTRAAGPPPPPATRRKSHKARKRRR